MLRLIMSPYCIGHMISYLPELDPQGNLKPRFNKADWDWVQGYVTYAELLEYAKYTQANYWLATQSFINVLFSGSINGVSASVFAYLANVSSDIQTQFDAITARITGVSYNASNGRTTVAGSLATPVLVLNNQNVGTWQRTVEAWVSALQTKTTAVAYNEETGATSVSGPLSVGSVILNGTDLGSRLVAQETETAALRTDVDALQEAVEGLDAVQAALDLKADDAAVMHLAGTETVSGQKDFVGGLLIGGLAAATQSFVEASIAALVGSAPETLNTLQEIAAGLQAEESATVSILNSITALSSSMAAQFAELVARLTNWTFYADTNTQDIGGLATAVQNTTATNALVSNTACVGSLVSQSVFTGELVCSSLKCSALSTAFPCPLVYLANGGVQYPLLKSGTVAALGGLDFSQAVFCTVAPGYRVVFVDANGCALAEVRNPTDDFVWNAGIQFSVSAPPVSFLIGAV